MTLAERFRAVSDRVARAAERAGRRADAVTIVAVSKTFGADAVREAIDAGITDLGESRAQEFADKVAVIGQAPRWHFVGHLQSNKVRSVVGVAALVHSVDRVELADRIARRARSLDITQDVLIQVNVSGEATKHGVALDRALWLADRVASLDGVALKGLMTMAPLTPEADESRPYYKELAALGDALRARVPSAAELSMGMTQDFEVAIEEGATIVRVGEAIFGPRT